MQKTPMICPSLPRSGVDFLQPAQALSSFLFPQKKRPAKSAVAHSGKGDTSGYRLVEHTTGKRGEVERFISQRFAESFGSKVEAFMPRLFSLRNQDDEICGTFGLRSASRKLFLEQYLDLPIEQEIAARIGRTASRQSIIEVGHFSGTFPGAVRAMIKLLTERLHHEGFEWVTFTGTASLRNAFSRLGLAPLDIQAAEANRLPLAERAAWGRYYEHLPRVLVGNIAEGYRAMRVAPAPNALDRMEHVA